MLGYGDSAVLFKALADETRLQIIDMLSCGELCACKILEKFAITQPTLSYHMKILTDCGLVHARKDGAWIRYTLNGQAADELQLFLSSITAAKNDCICRDGEE